jgi:ribosomal protein S18 acetylase RimI-like enzyme
MQPTLTFRPARAADVATLVALINSAYRGDSSRAGWTTEADLIDGPRTDVAEIARLVAADDSLLLLCLAGGDDIVGSVLLQRQATAGYLGMFVVRPGLQGAGTGKRLMQAAETLVREQWGLRRMTMTVITLRPELIAFYERRGYRRTGEILPFPPEHADKVKVGGVEMAVFEKMLASPDGADAATADRPRT